MATTVTLNVKDDAIMAWAKGEPVARPATTLVDATRDAIITRLVEYMNATEDQDVIQDVTDLFAELQEALPTALTQDGSTGVQLVDDVTSLKREVLHEYIGRLKQSILAHREAIREWELSNHVLLGKLERRDRVLRHIRLTLWRELVSVKQENYMLKSMYEHPKKKKEEETKDYVKALTSVDFLSLFLDIPDVDDDGKDKEAAETVVLVKELRDQFYSELHQLGEAYRKELASIHQAKSDEVKDISKVYNKNLAVVHQQLANARELLLMLCGDEMTMHTDTLISSMQNSKELLRELKKASEHMRKHFPVKIDVPDQNEALKILDSPIVKRAASAWKLALQKNRDKPKDVLSVVKVLLEARTITHDQETLCTSAKLFALQTSINSLTSDQEILHSAYEAMTNHINTVVKTKKWAKGARTNLAKKEFMHVMEGDSNHDADAGVDAFAGVHADTGVHADAGAHADTDGHADAGVDADASVDTDAGDDADADADADIDVHADVHANVHVDAVANADAGANVSTDADSGKSSEAVDADHTVADQEGRNETVSAGTVANDVEPDTESDSKVHADSGATKEDTDATANNNIVNKDRDTEGIVNVLHQALLHDAEDAISAIPPHSRLKTPTPPPLPNAAKNSTDGSVDVFYTRTMVDGYTQTPLNSTVPSVAIESATVGSSSELGSETRDVLEKLRKTSILFNPPKREGDKDNNMEPETDQKPDPQEEDMQRTQELLALRDTQLQSARMLLLKLLFKQLLAEILEAPQEVQEASPRSTLRSSFMSSPARSRPTSTKGSKTVQSRYLTLVAANRVKKMSPKRTRITYLPSSPPRGAILPWGDRVQDDPITPIKQTSGIGCITPLSQDLHGSLKSVSSLSLISEDDAASLVDIIDTIESEHTEDGKVSRSRSLMAQPGTDPEMERVEHLWHLMSVSTRVGGSLKVGRSPKPTSTYGTPSPSMQRSMSISRKAQQSRTPKVHTPTSATETSPHPALPIPQSPTTNPPSKERFTSPRRPSSTRPRQASTRSIDSGNQSQGSEAGSRATVTRSSSLLLHHIPSTPTITSASPQGLSQEWITPAESMDAKDKDKDKAKESKSKPKGPPLQVLELMKSDGAQGQGES